MEMLLIFLVFGASVVYAAQPLFEPTMTGDIDCQTEISHLEEAKLAVYRQIKQIDIEYELDLLSEEDFLSTRLRLKKEASALIDKLQTARKN